MLQTIKIKPLFHQEGDFMKYKAKIKAETIMTVWIHEDVVGNQEVEEVEEVDEVREFEIINKIG
jgi:hypothetical protein